MYFETERLAVRNFERKDFDEFNEMQTSSKVMKYTTGKANTREENKVEFENIIHSYSKTMPTRTIMAIAKKFDGTDIFIGSCATELTQPRCVEIGYRLLEQHWGNGFGLEIIQGLLTYAFENLGAQEVIAEAYVENEHSIKLLEKSPMRFVQEYSDEHKLVYVYSLNKNEAGLAAN